MLGFVEQGVALGEEIGVVVENTGIARVDFQRFLIGAESLERVAIGEIDVAHAAHEV